nr:xylulose kinase-1 [Tanacetum cinerariifolium]
MALTFADTHNMIAYLTKSDASEGFEQIIDFLNASAIHYALTVNPNIYVSCIKQFWSSVSVKKVNDVVRLQALIDRKNVIITEDTVREALHLDDAESIDCLSNEEIFTELARMGLVRNVDSSSKFYMYHRFLQLIIRAQVGDFSSHTTKYSSLALTQKVFANMRLVGKEFSEVDTPLFEGMIVAQQADDVVDEVAAGVDVDDVPDDVVPTPPPSPSAQPSSPPQQQQPSQPTHDAEISLDLLHTLLETCTTLTRRVETLEQDKVAQALEITRLKQRVRKLERRNKLKFSGLRRLKKVGTTQRVESSADTVMDDQEDASKHGGIIADLDADKDVTLEEVDIAKDVEVEENANVYGRPEESQAQIYKIDLEHADKVLSMQDDEPEPAELKEVVKEKGKQDNDVLKYQALKRKPQTEAQARKNMIVYLKNMAGLKMDYFKGMSYDDILPIFEKYFNLNVAFLEKTKEQLEEEKSRALKRKAESSEEQAVKKQKLDEKVEELKKHLQIVSNDDDDVYTEATPLALKVLVVNYKIYTENNKPYYKIKRADGSHQLFLSFLSLLRNFDREDLKMILLVERRYHLTMFTLDQMLNNVRLEVEEESEVSLELLSFGVDAAEDFKENMLRD